MAEVSGERMLRPFPALDPEPPRRVTWRSVRWPAAAFVVAVAVAAALLTWPSSSSRPVQAPFADRDGLVVFEQQPSGLLGTAAPDGSHRALLTKVGALQGTDLPVASGDGRYLVNLEGQLVTMGPAGPTSISSLPGSETQTAAAQAAGDTWASASFADGSRYLVATECYSGAGVSQFWVVDLIATAGGKADLLGKTTATAGDPESAGALVPAPVRPPTAATCEGQQSGPDKAIELLRPGQPPRTVVTAAELTGALGLAPGTPVMLAALPSPDGSRLALSVATAGVPSRQEMVVITRAGKIVAHNQFPADTNVVQWSPDGHQIAFCRAATNVLSSVTIWAVGQAARTIALPGRHDLACSQLLWSPDGSQLIYSAWVTDKGLTQADDMQRGWTVIDLRSGRVHGVTAPGQPAAWLPAAAGGAR